MPLPAGNNKCIGSFSNENNGKIYFFVWNDDDLHTVNEYDTSTNLVTEILRASYLNFGQYDYINGAGMINNQFLYWTDGVNPPRSIDVDKAKAGYYYDGSVSISLAKPPPQQLINAVYANGDSTSISINRLKNRLFQFKYLYVYNDGSRSAWSSGSTLPLPTFETTFDTLSYKNNHINLTFNAGTEFVQSIEIAAQVKGVATTEGTQDWFSVFYVDRSELLTQFVDKYSYDENTNTAIFPFYNDGLYQTVDVQEMDLPYDFVPLKSKTLEILNGNVLVLGNNTEGYDNIVPNATFNVTYDPVSSNRLSISRNFITVKKIGFYLSGLPVQGDAINYSYIEAGTTYNRTYTVSATDAGSLYNVTVAFASHVDFTNPSNWDQKGPIQIIDDNTTYVEFASAIQSNLNASVALAGAISNTIPSYKTNSRYQFGLVYYDEFNRSSTVQTTDNFVVATSSWGQTEGEVPKIEWIINNDAPNWATKYQWVRTEQLTHEKFLFWSASAVSANPLNSDLYNLNINSLNTFNQQNPNSILSYEFVEGDRCTIHRNNGTWVTGYDVEVVGYAASAGLLTIQKKAVLDAGASGVLLEVYTPKPSLASKSQQFFYEFGDQYACSGGVHSATTGFFTAGDICEKGRAISGVLTPLEDPNFSDIYVSNYSSNGRTNIFAPQSKQLTLPTDIRYSDTYVPNTNINGLSRFYGDAFETYDRVNGSIQKLAVRDNALITFQELKTGYIPVAQSIIEDQGVGNVANVAISNKLLNKIRYYAGDYGIGKNPESFSRFAGIMYFADPNRGEVLKLTQGLQPISSIGMDSYFTAKLSYTKNIANAKVIGSYDPRNDEYLLTFKYPSPTEQFPGNNQTVAFAEQTNRWTSFFSFIPEYGNYIFNQYVTFQNGSMWTHNTNNNYGNFYGSSYSSSVDIVYNASPSLIKTFIGVMEQASTVWTPVNIDTSTVQVSELPESSFTLKEGVYFASLLREKTGDIRSLYFGRDLKGNWIKLYLGMGSNAKQTLLSVDVRHIPSYQGIK